MSDSTPFSARTLAARPDWVGDEGIKIYTITVGPAVERSNFEPRLRELITSRPIDWPRTPAFAIFHHGAERLYLILAWWANGNELFTRVTVGDGEGWVEDSARYSFCVHDLEVFWAERDFFVRTLYGAGRDLGAYRRLYHTRTLERTG